MNPMPNENALGSINMRRMSDTRIPAIGVYGYNGTLNGRGRYGFFILSFIRERLTKANPNKEANAATEPTNSTTPVAANKM